MGLQYSMAAAIPLQEQEIWETFTSIQAIIHYSVPKPDQAGAVAFLWLARQEQQALREQPVLRDLRVLPEQQGLPEQQVHKGQRDRRGRQDQPEEEHWIRRMISVVRVWGAA
jgi:hypothetical protein